MYFYLVVTTSYQQGGVYASKQRKYMTNCEKVNLNKNHVFLFFLKELILQIYRRDSKRWKEEQDLCVFEGLFTAR